MITCRTSAKVIISLLLMVIPLAQVSAAPPVRYPQACARTFCVEVIPLAPYSPQVFTTSSSFEDGTSTLIVDLGEGLIVAFYSKYVSGPDISQIMLAPRWRVESDTASATGCLVCEEVGNPNLEVINITVKPLVPSVAENFLKGSDICYWPLQMDSVGYGDGKHLSIGDKVCVKL